MITKYDNFSRLKKTSLRYAIITRNRIILHETLHFDKFEDAENNYGDNFSNFQPKILNLGY